MRKLASIQEVVGTAEIPGANRIERVDVLGWRTVAEKGAFKKGDKVVFFEPDALIPVRPEFEYLRKSSYVPSNWPGKPEGFRIKTTKIRGQISHGLVQSLSILPDGCCTDIGFDVTEVLGVRKYEPRPSSGGNRNDGVIGDRPGFIPRTDEQRIQTLTFEEFSEFRKYSLRATEKLDGASMTVAFYDVDGLPRFRLFGRNKEIDPNSRSNPYAICARNEQLSHRLQLEWLRCRANKFIVSGEMVGPGIQGNRYRLHALQFYVFDVYDAVTRRRYTNHEIKGFCTETGFNHVPTVAFLSRDACGVEDFVDIARGKSLLYPLVNREGIVVRSGWPVDSRILSVKVINPDFLLEHED